MNPPRVSIVIAAYNAEKYVTQTLQSVLDQSLRDWECLVMDDGSQDDTSDIVRSFAARDQRIRLLQQPNAGVSQARNRTLSQCDAAAPYVVFLDSDDVWVPDALQTLHAALEANPGAIGAHALADFIDSDGQPIHPGGFSGFGRERTTLKGKRFVPLGEAEPTTFEVLITQGRIFPPGLALWRKNVVERAGRFDLRLAPQEDWDLWIRMSRFGPIVFVPQVVIWYRQHASNATQNFSKSYRSAALVRHKMFYAPENTRAQADAARRAYRALQAVRIVEKKTAIADCIRRRAFRQALISLARLVGNAGRYVRGFPTLRG